MHQNVRVNEGMNVSRFLEAIQVLVALQHTTRRFRPFPVAKAGIRVVPKHVVHIDYTLAQEEMMTVEPSPQHERNRDGMIQGEQFVTETARIAIDHNGVRPPIGHTR